MLTVQLTMNCIIAASPLNVTSDGDTTTLQDGTATDGADAMVKGLDKSLWDEEW